MRNGLLKGAVLALTLGLSAPGQAQESSYTPGNYSDVSAIDVLDGQFENYMDYLAGPWKAQQEFAKSKGYITGYQVLANPYARAGDSQSREFERVDLAVGIVESCTDKPNVSDVRRRIEQTCIGRPAAREG